MRRRGGGVGLGNLRFVDQGRMKTRSLPQLYVHNQSHSVQG